MDIQKYQSTTVPDTLAELLREKYEGGAAFNYFFDDFEKAYRYCVMSKHITFQPMGGYVGGKMCAHIALICDSRLPKGEAFFGFLECPKDVLVFRSLWTALVQEAKERGISVLKGPVNGSIWHQYRCVSSMGSHAFFKSELLCEPYYVDRLAAESPAAEVQYYSAYREPFENVLQMVGEESYAALATLGFSIKEATSVTLEELLSLRDISKRTFCDSWGYTELDKQEFVQLYSSEKLEEHLSRLYLLYSGDELIGFCGTSQEDEKTLICKTICILPPYQGRGLGSALAYKVHFDAQRAGYSKMIYALIREGNNIQNFPKDNAIIFRRYTAFEFHLD